MRVLAVAVSGRPASACVGVAAASSLRHRWARVCTRVSAALLQAPGVRARGPACVRVRVRMCALHGSVNESVGSCVWLCAQLALFVDDLSDADFALPVGSNALAKAVSTV